MMQILVFVSLLSVIGVVRKIVKAQKCPSDEQLRQSILFRNKRDETETDRIISHLGFCEKCRNKVSEFNEL